MADCLPEGLRFLVIRLVKRGDEAIKDGYQQLGPLLSLRSISWYAVQTLKHVDPVVPVSDQSHGSYTFDFPIDEIFFDHACHLPCCGTEIHGAGSRSNLAQVKFLLTLVIHEYVAKRLSIADNIEAELCDDSLPDIVWAKLRCRSC